MSSNGPSGSHDDSAGSVWGLVPAAGLGERFGGTVPKQLAPLNGRPLLAWTVGRLLRCGLGGVTIAIPGSWDEPKWGDWFDSARVRWVSGGESRQQSVEACLRGSPTRADDLVLVHDGARPAFSINDVLNTIRAAQSCDGAVLGRSMTDTLKRIDRNTIVETVERSSFFRAETPQVFRRSVLAEALAASREDNFVGTDDSSIVERLGSYSIQAVSAERPNPKLTEASDLNYLESLLDTLEVLDG